MKTHIDASVAAVGLATLVLLVVAWQQIHPAPEPTITLENSGVACQGLPIPVPYAYKGNPETPWECQVQCGSDTPHYIFYSNGLATQCDTPPSCNDRGEDDGVTCIPPDNTSAS